MAHLVFTGFKGTTRERGRAAAWRAWVLALAFSLIWWGVSGEWVLIPYLALDALCVLLRPSATKKLNKDEEEMGDDEEEKKAEADKRKKEAVRTNFQLWNSTTLFLGIILYVATRPVAVGLVALVSLRWRIALPSLVLSAPLLFTHFILGQKERQLLEASYVKIRGVLRGTAWLALGGLGLASVIILSLPVIPLLLLVVVLPTGSSMMIDSRLTLLRMIENMILYAYIVAFSRAMPCPYASTWLVEWG